MPTRDDHDFWPTGGGSQMELWDQCLRCHIWSRTVDGGLTWKYGKQVGAWAEMTHIVPECKREAA